MATITTMDPRRLRRIVAEDPEWNLSPIPSLARLCISQLTTGFAERPVFSELPPRYRTELVRTLGTDLPLAVTTELIDDDTYWKRCCVARWPTRRPRRAVANATFKRLFFESHLQGVLESLVPGNVAHAETLATALSVCGPHVISLDLRQLRPPNNEPPPPSSGEEAEGSKTEEVEGGGEVAVEKDEEEQEEEQEALLESWDHIELDDTLKALPNLSDLSVCYRVDDVKMDFKWKMFGATTADVEKLASAVATHGQQVTRLAVPNSLLDNKKVRILVRVLLPTAPSVAGVPMSMPCMLRRLDLSCNVIGDRGARALAKMVGAAEAAPVLEELILADNRIESAGALALGKALHDNDRLRELNLRMNALGDAGGHALFQALIGNKKLADLNLAGNGVSSKSVGALGEAIEAGLPLTNLDLTCNALGVETGRALLGALEKCTTVRVCDLRLTEVERDTELAIGRVLKNNMQAATAREISVAQQ